MARIKIIPLLLLFSTVIDIVTADPVMIPGHPQSSPYIETSCRATRYPQVCIDCLSSYPNGTIEGPQELAQAALLVSFTRAAYTRAYLMRVSRMFKRRNYRDYQAANDCLNQMNQGVTQLSMSIGELRRLGTEPVGDNFYWRISDVETWVGSMITDAMNCLDELPGRRMAKARAIIKSKMMNVAMVTSNALDLFHRFAAKYGAQASTKP